MTFISGKNCDVFLSYATANNQSFKKDEPGWVTSLRDSLKLVLDEGLERRGASEVWMDYKLRGNEPFDDQLQKTVSKSATLLVVLSEAYLKSDWCRRELEIFAEAARGDSGRIFLLHYEPVPYDMWPEQLRGLSSEKYRFFHQERDGAISKPLGFPIPDPNNSKHASFYDRLLELRKELCDKLDSMAVVEDVTAGSPTPTADRESSGVAVFLAEVCGETLYNERQLVKSHLEQCALRVLPTKVFGRNPTTEMDQEIAESTLFVQMLGRFGGGYETAHFQHAVDLGVPTLRWRNRDLDLATVDDPDHRKLLQGPVEALRIDELKRTIVDHVRRLATKRDETRSLGEHFFLVSAAQGDMPVADAVIEQLEGWQVGYDVVDESVSLQDLAESNAYDALMLIYGSCTYDWLRDQLLQCRKILLSSKSKSPSCAVYIGPPEGKQPLRCRPPRVAVIDANSGGQLRAFVESFSEKELT